ncbi:hypothetical protein [Persephonella sp.]
MINLKEITKELSIPEDRLIKEALKTYLDRKLLEIESEIFKLHKKWGVNSIEELNKLAEEGKISEEEALDDYFLLDNLETEREKILKALRKIDE